MADGQQTAVVIETFKQALDQLKTAIAQTQAAPSPKPWYRRTEVWLSLLPTALQGAQTYAANAPPSTALGITAAITLAGYAISRGLAKFGTGS